MKKCYYDVLQIDPKATTAEIKTSYRKLALKYHPDKNSEDDAKQRFVQINEAYNVLSDPNERTFYDNNREKLLFNKEEMSKEDLQEYTFGFNIWTYFTTSCFKGFEESEGGFYAVYRNVFELIKAEQTKAYSMRKDLEEDQKKYEGFGNSQTSMDRLLKFYQDWQNFNTYKTFAWSEQYDTRDANNRWVRREMQKQNKKQRQVQKKNYMKTIKDLVSYVRKRDPRFMQYLRVLRQQEQKKEQQRVQREKQKKRQKQEMKIIKQRCEEQRFKEIEQYYKNKEDNTQSNLRHQEQLQVENQFYCQICEKPFKSLNQLANHEKSKQHKTNLKLIQKEVMLKQQTIIRPSQQQPPKAKDAQLPKQAHVVEEVDKQKRKKKKKKGKQRQAQQDIQQKQQSKPQEKVIQIKNKQEIVRESSSDDDDAFMNALLNNRKKEKKSQTVENGEHKQKGNTGKPQAKNAKTMKVESKAEEQEQSEGQQRLGKAKLKKMKRAQQQKSKGSGHNCNTCGQSFPSKSRLFEHIKKTGHASAK